jgi:hypothetical protein
MHAADLSAPWLASIHRCLLPVLRGIPKALVKLQLSMPPAASQLQMPCETRSRRLMSVFRTLDNTGSWYVISIAVCTVDWSKCHKHQNALSMCNAYLVPGSSVTSGIQTWNNLSKHNSFFPPQYNKNNFQKHKLYQVISRESHSILVYKQSTLLMLASF